jgi:hypothetical protein
MECNDRLVVPSRAKFKWGGASNYFKPRFQVKIGDFSTHKNVYLSCLGLISKIYEWARNGL